MGAQGKAHSSANSMQRVKVYRLNDDGKWDDRGTGHISVDSLERSEDLSLFVIDEQDNQTLLAHRIRSDEIYRRQEDTIISWRDSEYSTEVALSFQEATGCSYIWDHICSTQRNLHFNTLSDLEIGPRPATGTLETSQAIDETFHSVTSELRELPAVELSTLPLILKTVLECGFADQMRVIELILQDGILRSILPSQPFVLDASNVFQQDFFPKLMDLFRICEGLGNIDGLHMISKLVKGIILLNSPHIFEKMFKDEFIMDIIGCLEYDSEVYHVQHHRAFLKEHVIFKEAIPIKDPIVLSKIHQTYKVGYLKDVILPRILDEPTIANLNSIIHANNAIVVSLLKDDNTFIQELFARMRSSTISAESKKNLVFFLHEFCNLSKSPQLVQQLRLFRDLMNEGIFDIVTDALQSQDKRLILTGTDILILFLNQDPNLLRAYVTRQEGSALLGLLVKGVITDFGEDMHCQFLEIIRILLDSYTLSGPQRDTVIEIFYEKHLDQLIDVITSSCSSKGIDQSTEKSSCVGGRVGNHGVTKPEILSNICELLCFCVHHHPYRIKSNFLYNNVIEKVLFLTRRREKYLVVAAVRFMRTIISCNDDQLLLHIVKNNLLKPIVEAFVANGNRYNLLNSAVLELFEFIRKENLSTLITYLIDSFWKQLAEFECLSTVHGLKVKYEQSLENCLTKGTIDLVDPRKCIDECTLEKEEDDYFNGSDEEDTASARSSVTHNQQAQPVLPNGASFSYSSLSPGSGRLVDYDDDDDDDEDHDIPSRSKSETSNGDAKATDSSPKSKRKSSNEELELTKKRRLDKAVSDSVVAACSTCDDAASPSKEATTVHRITHCPDEKCNLDEETHGEKEPAVPRSCSDCLPNTQGSRQSDGEECPPNANNSSLEVVVNGTSVTDLEPYSVR